MIWELVELEKKIKKIAEEINIDITKLYFFNGKIILDDSVETVVKFEADFDREVVEKNKYDYATRDNAHIIEGYIKADGYIFCNIKKLVEHPIEEGMTVPATFNISYYDGNIDIERMMRG